VLICLDRDPEIIMRDVAMKVGITERAVQKIVAELEAGGIIRRKKIGRRNRYTIDRRIRLRHSLEAHRRVGDLLNAIS
jgi:DNA-binding Lrp family transcriptional regulator